MKKLIEKFIINYTDKHTDIQKKVVEKWSKGEKIENVYIKDSTVTLDKINAINVSITGCRINPISKDNSIKIN